MLISLPNKPKKVEFTALEKEILIYMQKGLSSEEIGLLFNCNKPMINAHRRSILQKTGAQPCLMLFRWRLKEVGCKIALLERDLS